ncbi:MAG: UDP-N-acetylmuramoyl-L-alanyl-D-glutamate--2,6-diaminopimelate ligase [Dongiaceae bacterium]
MQLATLLDDGRKLQGSAMADLEIRGLTADSRAVEPGFLFAALPGSHADGRDFIGDALARGAVAVLAPNGTSRPAGSVALIEDENPRRRLAQMAARFYERQPATIAAVTGTSGKTSVTAFARQLWTLLGHRAASLGTLGIVTPEGERPGALTTPDPVVLHRDLAALADAGIDHLAIEASSHGLEQYRLDGLRLRAAAFTNLSRDHLDYHPDMAAYFKAKRRLFCSLLPIGGVAVLNADAPEYETLRDLCRACAQRIVAYGRNGADLTLLDTTPHGTGQRLALRIEGRRHDLDFPVAGAFQAMNLLAALGLVMADGVDAARVLPLIGKLEGVHGRMELVAHHPNGAPVYVDYAHKPHALETVLAALRPHTAGKLVVVFGCGGDRDRGKRPEMGAIATRLADVSIVTDDNPRSEDPAAIRKAILAAAPGAIEIGDRAEAIRSAIAMLEPGDLLVVAGKGHETGQTIAGKTHPFDDSAVARAAVAQVSSGGAA